MPILNKRAGEEASELEKKIESAMKELLAMKNATEEVYLYRSLLKGLYFVGAQEFELKDDSAVKSCIVIHVPVPQLREWKRAQTKVVREMEAKMFSGSHVVVIAKRRILPKPLRGKSRRPQKQKRPRSRTLTAVHEETLNDLVYPAEVVGRRIRYKTDGKQVLKVHLDKLHKNYVEHKVDTFKSVYKKITNKSVEFEFPEPVF